MLCINKKSPAQVPPDLTRTIPHIEGLQPNINIAAKMGCDAALHHLNELLALR